MSLTTMPQQPVRKRPSRWLIVAIFVPIGLAIGFGLVGGILAMRGVQPEVTATTPVATAPTTPIHVNAVVPGTCLANPADTHSPPRILSAVECTDAHPVEIIGVHIIEGDAFPGSREIDDIGDKECRIAINDVPSSPALGSEIHQAFMWVPGKGSWDAGDRTVICYAALESGSDLIGSLLDGSASTAE